MRRDDLYLNDIVEAADHIATFLRQADFEGFEPHIPWPQIVAFRNILIHAYFGIDWNVVW
jgi:uncharacterized protein with HEPN domain